MTEPIGIEEPTPDLGAVARKGRLNELGRRLEALITTGRAIHAEDPELLDAHFSQQAQMAVLAIHEGVKARADRIAERMDNVDTT